MLTKHETETVWYLEAVLYLGTARFHVFAQFLFAVLVLVSILVLLNLAASGLHLCCYAVFFHTHILRVL